MDFIKINNNSKFNFNSKISIVSLVDLPSLKFDLDNYRIFDQWSRSISRLILRSYIGLIISDVIKVGFVRNNKSLFFGKIKWQNYSYFPMIKQKNIDLSSFDWIEQQIINSIILTEFEKDKLDNKVFFNQIQLLVDLLLGNGEHYENPGKKIAEDVLLKQDSNDITFKVFKIRLGYSKHYEIEIKEGIRQLFQEKIELVDNIINRAKLNNVGFRFLRLLELKIKRKITSKRYISPGGG